MRIGLINGEVAITFLVTTGGKFPEDKVTHTVCPPHRECLNVARTLWTMGAKHLVVWTTEDAYWTFHPAPHQPQSTAA